jgi:hypothetical protein
MYLDSNPKVRNIHSTKQNEYQSFCKVIEVLKLKQGWLLKVLLPHGSNINKKKKKQASKQARESVKYKEKNV